MGSSLQLGSLFRVLFHKGAVLCWEVFAKLRFVLGPPKRCCSYYSDCERGPDTKTEYRVRNI